MITATQSESRPVRRGVAPFLKALHAEWRKLSPQLESELPERELRLAWTNERLKGRKSKIESWSDLSQGEARRLLKIMREESGDGPAWRAQFIAQLAVRLFGTDWDAMLAERVRTRHGVPLQELSPAQAHETIEELLSRIARAEGKDIEQVRAELRRGKL